MKNKLKLILVIMVSLAMILPACGQAPTPVATEAATEVPTEVATDVPTEAPVAAGATNTMQSMIDQGAGMIIATGSQHQYPALGLAEANPDVIFEHAGGWETRDNFGIFFGSPPDGWYLMGIAAGKT